ncbi:MAG: CoA transferase [Actinobacteria bacterium]|nr:CoA transferase [Actinomycetota bacterium]
MLNQQEINPDTSNAEEKPKALSRLRVLELGTLIGGPFAGRIFADFGAEVIKVEPPGVGDPLRNWRIVHEGTSLWWYSQSRNKKSVTLDLRNPEGQRIARDLACKADVVIENFRPGTLEKWGLGYDKLSEINPGLVMIRVSGYGQTGPYRDKAGFGVVGEAMGGLRHITGYPDRPPTRVGISLGDSLAALYGVIGALMALYHRDIAGGRGQYIDIALYEAVFSLMESTIPEYDQFGFIRERTGSTLPGIAPSNIYPSSDGKYVVIGGNGDAIFKRLMKVVGRPDLADDERFAGNQGRVQHAEFLDQTISEWTSRHTLKEVMAALDEAAVPAGPIYNAADMVQDPHYLARGMIETVQVPGLGPLKIPGVVPKLSETPGRTEWPGPKLGEHNEEVYCGLLGLKAEELDRLRGLGVI